MATNYRKKTDTAPRFSEEQVEYLREVFRFSITELDLDGNLVQQCAEARGRMQVIDHIAALNRKD